MCIGEKMSTTDTSQENLVRKMKLAVAMGCLKNKPAGMSGRDYAQQLCNKFQGSQLEWKRKYEGAETEILHLKQQLALRQSVGLENMEVPMDDDDTGSDSLFPTPPSSGSHGNQTVKENSGSNSVTDSLSKHTLFLHHVISLQNGSKLFTDKNIDELTKKSIQHSLDIVQEHIGDSSIPSKLQIQFVQCIDKLYRCCGSDLKRQILKSAKVSAEKLIAGILSRDEYRTQTQKEHRDLLQELSNKNEISVPVIELLVDAIKTFSDTLRQVVNKEQTLDPYYFCNSYYIIKILDQSLESSSGDDCSLPESGSREASRLSGDLRNQILMKLEDSLLHITEKFPMFAHAVWRLTSKLNG